MQSKRHLVKTVLLVLAYQSHLLLGWFEQAVRSVSLCKVLCTQHVCVQTCWFVSERTVWVLWGPVFKRTSEHLSSPAFVYPLNSFWSHNARAHVCQICRRLTYKRTKEGTQWSGIKRIDPDKSRQTQETLTKRWDETEKKLVYQQAGLPNGSCTAGSGQIIIIIFLTRGQFGNDVALVVSAPTIWHCTCIARNPINK